MSEKRESSSETNRGEYIVIEGPEAVGKSTQVQKMAGRLATYGIEARTDIREPGGTPMGEGIRELLKNKELGRSALTNLLLFNASRAEILPVINEEIEAGRWVITDRDYTSSYAYQVCAEGVDRETYASITKPVIDICSSRITLIMMASEEEQAKRQRIRATTDHFELQSTFYHQKVRQGYIRAAQFQNGYLVDGEGSEDAVHERMWAYVAPLLSGEYSYDKQQELRGMHEAAMQKYGVALS